MSDYLFIDDRGRLLDLLSFASLELAKAEAERLAAAHRAGEVTIGYLVERVPARCCPRCGYPLELERPPGRSLFCPTCP